MAKTILRHLRPLVRFCLVFLLAWSATAGEPPDDRWIFDRVREGINSPLRPGGFSDTGAGLAGFPEVAPTDPLYPKVSGLFSKSCGYSGEKEAPPVPWGKLVRRDVDGDGQPELVFAGGCSPEPHFTVLKGAADSWRVWRHFRGRLLSISRQGDRVVSLSAIDALGIARNNGLSIRSCGLQDNDPCLELVFLWVSELEDVASKGGVTPCSTRRDTALRSSPQVDNTPQESGMGFDWPGNLYQMLAKGSTGWRLDRTKAPDGTSWSVCVFPAPAVLARDQDPKQISIPKTARRLPLPGDRPTTELLVGWIKTTDLSEP